MEVKFGMELERAKSYLTLRMADDDIQLNFASPLAKPDPKSRHVASEFDKTSTNTKKRERKDMTPSSSKTTPQSKMDVDTKKSHKKEEKSKSFSEDSSPKLEESPNKTMQKSIIESIDEKALIADNDRDVKEPPAKRPKGAHFMTAKQKIRETESNYAKYVKEQSKELPKMNQKQGKNSTGSHFTSMAEVGKDLDIFSDKSFADLGLDSYLVKNLEGYMDLSKPTQIQRYSIPVLTAQRDALIKAHTGSGKTLAYLIPIVHDIIAQAERKYEEKKSKGEIESDSDEEDDESEDEDESLSGDSERDTSDSKSNSNENFRMNIDPPPSRGSGRITKYSSSRGMKQDQESIESEVSEFEEAERARKKKNRIRRARKLSIDRASGTHAMIIAPTRELTLQIFEVLKKLLRPFPQIVPGVIMGGEKRKSEKARLRKGIGILVATPGRLLDHLTHTSAFHWEKCQWLVLDEADRLLDMGFEKDINSIIHALDSKSHFSKRHNVLASATLNKDVNRLALLSLNSPVFVSLDASQHKHVNLLNMNETDDTSTDEQIHELPAGLKQHVVVVDDKRKLITLLAWIRSKLKQGGTKIIVFFSSCDSVDFFYLLCSMIEVGVSNMKGKEQDRERLIPAPLFKLHGNLSQDVRNPTYQAFSACTSGVLFCTDVAARGLDVPAVNWIVQYDVPSDPSAYIHRIGRTARIGSSGDAILLLLQHERPYLDVLLNRKMTFDEIPSKEVIKSLKVFLEPNPSNDPLLECSSLQFRIDTTVETGSQVELKNLAIKAFQAFIRSYATHTKSTKHIFHIKNLHLGHLCRNFGLREAPSSFGKTLQSSGLGKKEVQRQKERARDKEKKKLRIKPAGLVTLDEFAM